MNTFLSIASGAVFILGTLLYIRDMIWGKTRPAILSWVAWAIIDIILIAGMYDKGTLNWQVTASAFCATTIALLALAGYGVRTWNWINILCIVTWPFGLLLWWYTANAWWDIFIALTLIVIACWPTFESAWREPKRENRWAWLMVTVSSVIMLMALPSKTVWTFELAAQPIVYLATQLVMIWLVWIRPAHMRLAPIKIEKEKDPRA